MDFKRLSKVLGILILFVGVMQLLVMGYAVLEGVFRYPSAKNRDAIMALFLSFAITSAAGGGLLAIGRKAKNEFLRREAMATVGLSWFLSAIFSGLPYFLLDPETGPRLGAVGSFFESMSGLTTTGASVMIDIELFPKAILLWRSVTAYMGGIGIVVLFVSVLSFLGVGGRNLVAQESSINISDSRASKIRETALGLLRTYLVLSLICLIGLLALGMPMFDSVCHTMTTIATAGFSPRNASIGHYNHVGIEIWVGIFMLLGSLGFMFYLLIFKPNKDERDIARIRNEEEIKYYLIFILVAIVLVTGNQMYGMGRSLGTALRESFFMVISISSSTGFGVGNYDTWPTFSKIVFWILMAVGGCAGSTAGGLKMYRIILFKRVAENELVQSFRPNKVTRIKLNGLTPDAKVLFQSSLFLSLAVVMCGFSMVVISLIEPEMNFESVVGAVTACLFNVGPGFDQVGPTDNYGSLNQGTLAVLSVLMAMGRLEFIAVLVLFLPSLWRRY